jgi:tetratricopeptide (TPR) repeat protein
MSDSPRIEELRRRVQGDPASIAFAALAEEFRRAGRFKEAVETSRAGLRHHPTYVSARVTLGRSLVELQEFEQAERELAFVLRSAPDNLAARRALGELCWQRLRFADALTHFKAALALAPRDAELPGVIASLERELESERAAVATTTPAAAVPAEAVVAESVVAEAVVAEAVAADGDTMRMASATVLAAEPAAAEAAPAGAGKQLSTTAAIAALEKFYRAVVRARDAKPPAAA